MIHSSIRRRSDISRILGAVGMLLGGVVIVLTTALAQGPGGLHISLFGFGLGLALSVAGTWFAAPDSSLAGQVLALAGSALWFAGWMSPFFLGWVIPIPLWLWAGLAASLYASSVITYAVGSSVPGGLFGLFLVLGSAWSMILLLQNPVFAPIHAYVPYALAMILAATVSIFIPAGKRPESMRRSSPTRRAGTPQ